TSLLRRHRRFVHWEAVRRLRGVRSFPTRRSSDLALLLGRLQREAHLQGRRRLPAQRQIYFFVFGGPSVPGHLRASPRPQRTHQRSEEHTSELQSLAYLVCRLLLEKNTVQRAAAAL